MKKQFVVIGCGRFGQSVAIKLAELGCEVMVVDDNEEIIQNILENIHNKFVSHVATSRNLEFNYVLNYSTGEIFLGDKAKEIGFIDEIGYYPDVIRDLKNRINVTSEILIVEYKPQLTFFEQISTSASSSFIPNTNSQILLK